ncbi:hypothetical protein CDV49_09935 [Haematobacter genomosp. 1]|uniref:Uncharacterized protein n=1 Tax=Haematobacter genomosp. 1 TaxID=366618 RepID=A0A212ABJ8_9RHOB|nr:hypothetical protein CDV49_09935 [Haematobacter genomosp. 1]
MQQGFLVHRALRMNDEIEVRKVGPARSRVGHRAGAGTAIAHRLPFGNLPDSTMNSAPDSTTAAKPGFGNPVTSRETAARVLAKMRVSAWGRGGDTLPGYRLPATGYRLPATGYRLPATGYRLPATGYRLPATGYRQRGTAMRALCRA